MSRVCTNIVWLTFSLLLLGSCVTNKKIQYLQYGNETDNQQDTTVRQYNSVYYAYKLKPEDQVSVQFESLTPKEFDFLNPVIGQQLTNMAVNPQLTGKLIDPEGNIPFPFIGKVKIAGKTLYEAEEYLRQIADEYLDSPVVRVRLLNFRVTFLGEVNKEGTVLITNNQISLAEAVGWAGGLTDFAARDRIKIIRQEGGQTEVRYVNLLDEKFITSPYYYVYPNDVIVVPPLKVRPYLKYTTQNLTFLISVLNLAFIVISLR